MKNELQAINTEKVIGNFTQAEIDTLKQTIAKGTTNEQFSLFVQTCSNSGLNPFLGQIYCIMYNSTMNIQTSAEGYLAMAKKFDDFDGITSAVVKENDIFEADLDLGTFVHKVKFPRGKTAGAYCQARRKGFKPFLALVDREQADSIMNGSNNSGNWKKYYDDFITKTAEKRGLRKQFGLEIPDEDGGAFTAEPVTVESIPEYKPKFDPDSKFVPPIDSEVTEKIEIEDGVTVPAADLLQQAWDDVETEMERLGMTQVDLKNAIIKFYKSKKPKMLSAPELVALKKLLETYWKEINTPKEEKTEQTGLGDLMEGL